MDILKKSLMPIAEKSWNEIVRQSEQHLKTMLTARKFVDVSEPKGWEFSAVPLGRLEFPSKKSNKGIKYGTRQVLPLVEIRVPFRLNIWDLDNITRGAEGMELINLEKAALEIATFEDRAIYHGLTEAGIKGLQEISSYNVRECPRDAENILHGITEGISLLKESAINGPYTLVVNPRKWLEISSASKGYPLKRQLEELLEGQIIFCPHVEELYLVSERGGDFQLTLGQDISIGYESHDEKEIQLFFTETFTFQALEPRAVVIYK